MKHIVSARRVHPLILKPLRHMPPLETVVMTGIHEVRAYKLFRVRRDGSLGSLFINRGVRLPQFQWLRAEAHPTKGYTVRPGWHCTAQPRAPHLSMKGRAWFEVGMRGRVQCIDRPARQGGLWYLATEIIIEDRIWHPWMVLNEKGACCPHRHRKAR